MERVRVFVLARAAVFVVCNAHLSLLSLLSLRSFFLVSLPTRAGYRPKCYWWENFVIGRKLLVILVGVVTNDAHVQSLLVVFITVCALIGHITVQPFVKPLLNRFEVRFVLVCVAAVLLTIIDAHPFPPRTPLRI
jgi:hypothetical protein